MSHLAVIETPGTSGNRIAFGYRARSMTPSAGSAGGRRALYHDLALLGAGFLVAALVLA